MGTAYNVCSMEDIAISWLLCWQWKYTTQNIIYLYFKNRALAPLQIPASLCEGPIYLLLCWVITLLIKKHPLEHTVICIHYYWFILGMTWLDLFYHELQCLVSPWSLKVLCIYVLRSQKGLARYHLVISYYDCFEKVLSSEIYYYCSLVDYAIDMSKLETYALLWIWLVHNLCWKLECWLYIFTTTRANRVCKSFSLSLSVYQLNCLRTSKGLSLGELIRLRRIYFSKHFCPCFGL